MIASLLVCTGLAVTPLEDKIFTTSLKKNKTFYLAKYLKKVQKKPALGQGCPLNKKIKGKPLLHYAVDQNNLLITKYLIGHGADICSRNRDDTTSIIPGPQPYNDCQIWLREQLKNNACEALQCPICWKDFIATNQVFITNCCTRVICIKCNTQRALCAFCDAKKN